GCRHSARQWRAVTGAGPRSFPGPGREPASRGSRNPGPEAGTPRRLAAARSAGGLGRPGAAPPGQLCRRHPAPKAPGPTGRCRPLAPGDPPSIHPYRPTTMNPTLAPPLGSSLESLMYGLSQLFLIPVMLTIAWVFLYAFYALGAFGWQAL